MNKKEAIALWKELEVTNVEFIFSCGGDSMSSTEIIINGKTDLIKNQELTDYFDRKVYDNVDFYVNSDGHYQGEAGTVYITLEDDDFIYVKDAMSEYINHKDVFVDIKLSQDEVDYINKYILSISGIENGESLYNYKLNFVKHDRFEEIEQKILDKISESYDESLFSLADDEELTPWEQEYRFSTIDPIKIEKNTLTVIFTIKTVSYENSY